MKQLIILFTIVALWQPVFCNEQHENSKTISSTEKTAKNSVKIGYFVYVQKCGEVAELKTTDLDEAQVFIRSFYPYFCEDLEYEFQHTPFYRVNCFEKEIYIEQMRITKSGKYKQIKNFKKGR